MSRPLVEMFMDDGVLRIYPDGGGVGQPCLEIPGANLVEWAQTLLNYNDPPLMMLDDSDPVSLPGVFGKLTDQV